MAQGQRAESVDPQHVGRHAALDPERPAIIMARTGEALSFAGYEALSNQCAQLLRHLGLARGDNVAIAMQNHLYYLPLAWGAMRAGLRVTTIATHLTTAEADYIVRDCGARCLFTSSAMAEQVAGLISIAPAARFMVGGTSDGQSLEAALEAMPATPIADQSEGVEMLYSSGTTGLPKGIKKSLPTQPFGEPLPALRRWAAHYAFGPGSVYLSPAPLYHAAPLMFNVRVGRFGGTSIVMDRFDAAEALALIQRYRVTHSQWVPTMFVRLLRLPVAVRGRYDLSSHRVAIHAAAPCPVEVKRAMIDWWGPIIHEYYGGSEGNGLTNIDSADWLAHPGSVGQAFLGTLKICDARGRPVRAGEIGTVYFADGPVFEYHNDPGKTAESRHPAGWSTLGDVGYLDPDGYLYLTDRHAFVINSGGVNIYPQEAENLLVSHPAVLDAAVFGIPDPEFGEAVQAVIQPVDRSRAGPAFEAELIAYCRARLSAVKCPKSIDFLDQMPRHDNGKLYKRLLQDRYRQAGDTGR